MNGAFGLDWALYWTGKAIKTKYNYLNFINNESKWLSYRPLNKIDYFATGKELPLYRTFLEHVTLDSYWKKLILTEKDYSNINIPSLSFVGWFDGTLSGTVLHFENLINFSSNKKDRFLFIGPYAHENAPGGGYSYSNGKPVKQLGDLHIEDNAFIPGLNMTKDFYDWCLKNKTRPDWKNENAYITGTNKWLNGEHLFMKNTKESYLYLSSLGKTNGLFGNSNGKLSFDAPNFQHKDEFLYNPNKPVRSDEKDNVIYPVDINFYLNRSDVLVYTSDVLKSPLTMIGKVEIELTISASTTDTDFIVFMMDVYEDGRSIKMGSDFSPSLRTRYREGYEKEVLMKENTKYNIKISFNQMFHTFLSGHKIRLAITSSFFPWINANPNTGKSIETDTDEPIISNQTIYYGNPKDKIISRIKFRTFNASNSISLNKNIILFYFCYIVFLSTNINF
jgi:putative CocE/NonD family hydrolase